MAAPIAATRASVTFAKQAVYFKDIKIFHHCCRLLSSGTGDGKSGSLAAKFLKATETKTSERRPLCRTPEANPVNHNIHHEALFYNLPETEFNQYMTWGMLPEYFKMTKAFNETTLMIRKPALEIMDCIRSTDFSHPTIRYLLYGKNGAGKTCSLLHLMHFCGKQDWLVVYVPWCTTFIRHWRDYQTSSFKPGRLDLPLDSALWLSKFKATNSTLLNSLKPVTQHKYVWTKRENSEVGTPWLDIIEFGLARVKYANDVIGVLVNEIKEQSSQGRFKTLVAMDGINAFWVPNTTIKVEEDRTRKHPPEDISLVCHMKKLLRNDWNGAACVASVDTNAGDLSRQESYLPRYLLGKEGFDHLEPFIPVHVPDYNDKEINSCIDYYLERKWLHNPHASSEDGRRELIALSSYNPRELFITSKAW